MSISVSATRMCRLLAALLVCVALTAGWSAGVARADDSPGDAGSTGTSDTSGADTSPASDGGDTSDDADEPPDDDADPPAETPPSDITEPDPPPVNVNEDADLEHDDTNDTTPSTPRRSRHEDIATEAERHAETAVQESDSHDLGSDGLSTDTAVDDAAESGVDEGGVAPAPIRAPSLTERVTAPAAPEQAPAPQPDVVRTVTHLVAGVVNAIFSPFAATNGPARPTDAAWTWALLAFSRREFDTASASPTAQPEPGVATTHRTLVLTAFPAEADAILARTTLDPDPVVVVDGHRYYLGTLGGKPVIVAMTGIGMENATDTTETALEYFPEHGTSVDAVVFSGVAGGYGRTEIGSVAVPGRWTSDDGQTWHAVDPDMLAVADALDVDLLRTDSVVDPAGPLGVLAAVLRIDLGRAPQVFVGGDGASGDDNNGVAFPSIPLGGAIFGPQPYLAPDWSPLRTGNFFEAVVPFIAVGIVGNVIGFFDQTALPVDAVDQETAAAQQVADAHGIPFLGIRGMSDGPGDPLNLPGYPVSFFVYNQIAANNAAIVTEAFLTNWDGPQAD